MPPRTRTRLPAVLGLVCAALGATALVGWYASGVSLVRLHPALDPMWPDTAAALALGGLALFAAATGRPRLTLAAAGPVLLAALSLARLFGGTEFRVDRLPIAPAAVLDRPGAMSANAAWCLLLVTGPLLFTGVVRRGRWRAPITAASAAAGLAWAAVAVFWLAAALATDSAGMAPGRGRGVGMAPTTSVVLAALAVGVLALAWRQGRPRGGLPAWAAVPAGVGAVTAALVLAQALAGQESSAQQAAARGAAEASAGELGRRLPQRVELLRHVAQFCRRTGKRYATGGEMAGDWPGDYLAGVRGIEGTDLAGAARWVVPQEGNGGGLAPGPTGESRRRAALERARAGGGPMAVSAPVDLPGGGAGFLVVLRRYHEQEPAGFYVIAFRADAVLDDLLDPRVAPGYALAVRCDSGELYARGGADRRYEAEWGREEAVPLGDTAWRVRAWPSAELMSRQRTALPQAVLGLGLAAAALLAVATHLARRAGVRARQAEAAGRRARAEAERRRRAEDGLRESERQYRALAESIPQLVWVTGPDGDEQYFNRRLAVYLGCTAGPPTWDWVRVVHPDDLPGPRDGWRRAVALGEPYESEYRLRRADGEYRWHITRALPLRDGQGRVVRWFGTCTDIHDRRQAEEALRASEARYRLLFDRNLSGVFRSTPAGRILDCNDAFARIFGHASAAEAMARPARDLYADPDDRDAFLAALRERGFLAGHEFRARRRDGSEARLLENVTLVTNGGGAEVIEGTLIDVTERVRLEGQLRQAQKMEAVGRLAGGVAHDFNNLLTAINGYGELVLVALGKGHPARELVGEMTRAGERAARLTQQLLAFSRRQVIAPEVLDLNALVADLGRLLRRTIGEDVELATELQPGLGGVLADRGQLEQVALNLAVNARDAMPKGGRLTVRTRDAADPAGLPPGRYVVLEVSDTGCGMTEEVRAHVFEPFFTTKEVGKGTGLGLATVYGVVTQAGGRVEVDSAPGRGATFRVVLPRAAGDARPAGRRPPAAAAPRGAETVLLAEDEDAVRSLARHVLAGHGYAVLEAADGVQALHLAGRHGGAIDLLVTDVVMPDLGGRELAERLTRLHPAVKVLYISGYTDDAVVRHGVARDEVNFLQKPFSPQALARKVREVLGPAG
jgi:PAS domain S-box-containing protein